MKLYLKALAGALLISVASLSGTSQAQSNHLPDTASHSSTSPAASSQPTPDKRAHANWIQPVPGKITNPFGNSYQYYQVYRGGHTGVDIAAPRGTLIKAVADGKVVRIFQKPNQRYGQYVIIQHSSKLFSLYGHLQTVKVKTGQQIKQGQFIATVGATGAAGYPHLHLEAIDRLPSRDGAWGYLYICNHAHQEQNFINHNTYEIKAIQRQRGKNCLLQKLPEPITYLNPEAFWNSKTAVSHQLQQPENEERRYHKTPTAKVQVKPSQPPKATASPKASAEPQPETTQKSAAPDKSPAP